MTILSKVRHFITRNKNKFIVGGIVITGSIFLTRYAQQKLKEWQEKEMLEFLDRTRKQQHFETISRTCNQTFVNLANSLTDIISQANDTDKIISDLRTKPNNKISAWENLKVLLIAKSCCLIYAMSILSIILRIQLYLIGGHLCKNPSSISTESQEKFLSSTETFLNEGVKELSTKLTEVCKKVIDQIDLKKQMRPCDIDALFWSLQTAICDTEENPLENLSSYIKWHLNDKATHDNIYQTLIRDAQDLLESHEVKSLTSQCVNRGFTQLANQLSEFYTVNSESNSNGFVYSKQEDCNNFNTKKPLAKLLPIINGLLSKHSFPEKLKQQLVTYDKSQIFAANIFESLL